MADSLLRVLPQEGQQYRVRMDVRAKLVHGLDGANEKSTCDPATNATRLSRHDSTPFSSFRVPQAA